MKVILLKDVKGQGRQGDIVDLSDGYVRNYLLPQKLARIATDSSINDARTKMAAQSHQKQMEEAEAREYAKKLSELSVTVHAKRGQGGRLFGSIGPGDVADALEKEHGIQIDKKKIVLKDHIKECGQYTVSLKLYANVSASLKVTVDTGETDG